MVQPPLRERAAIREEPTWTALPVGSTGTSRYTGSRECRKDHLLDVCVSETTVSGELELAPRVMGTWSARRRAAWEWAWSRPSG